jgi:cellulose synthase (UDP-forming)
MQQSVFYESLCEAKSSVNAMFCCGTNALIRRSALERVGGFSETVVTEDFATSVQWHLLGYKSVYYNHASVFGEAPENLASYFKQQARWAAGTTRVLRTVFGALFTAPTKLSLNQWWEYFLSGSYYFVGWSFFFLMLCPIAFLLFGFPTYFVHPVVYLGTFVPYFAWTLGLFYGTMMRRHYKPSDVYNGVILSSLSFPILMKATILGMFGKRMTFTVTPKGDTQSMPLQKLWPWTGMIALNFVAMTVGLMKIYSAPYAIIVNIFWCGYHIFVLGHIYQFNRQETLALAPLPPSWQLRTLYSIS